MTVKENLEDRIEELNIEILALEEEQGEISRRGDEIESELDSLEEELAGKEEDLKELYDDDEEEM